jgi:predicted nucleic acid-binding protein
MAAAYVDSSCLLAVAFGEPGARRAEKAIRSYSPLLASNVVEAEVGAVLAREGTTAGAEIFKGISWVFPDRALTAELERALDHGRLRGADLWHVACALYLDPSAKELAFLTLDGSQGQVAAAVGFEVL